jgi:hypothetical protein
MTVAKLVVTYRDEPCGPETDPRDAGQLRGLTAIGPPGRWAPGAATMRVNRLEQRLYGRAVMTLGALLPWSCARLLDGDGTVILTRPVEMSGVVAIGMITPHSVSIAERSVKAAGWRVQPAGSVCLCHIALIAPTAPAVRRRAIAPQASRFICKTAASGAPDERSTACLARRPNWS